MTVYVMWWGGCSYSHGDMDRDLEVFSSVQRAGEALRDRYDSNGQRQVSFTYADGRTERTLVPSVTTDPWGPTSMEVYLYDPRTVVDPYPSLRLTLGPRLGVRRERY